MAGDVGPDALAPWSWREVFEPGAQAAIRASAAVLARDQDAFTRQLHSDVTSLIPESALPRGFDMRGFCERMAQALLWLALSGQSPPAAIAALRELGSRNWSDGFPDSQYGSVAHAVIQTVHYLSASSWTTSTGSSWISFFMWVQSHLLAGARAAAAAREAAAREAPARETAAQRAAAEREAARAAARSRDRRSGQANVLHDAAPERARPFLDDDDDDDENDTALGQIMLGMTKPPRRHQP